MNNRYERTKKKIVGKCKWIHARNRSSMFFPSPRARSLVHIHICVIYTLAVRGFDVISFNKLPLSKTACVFKWKFASVSMSFGHTRVVYSIPWKKQRKIYAIHLVFKFKSESPIWPRFFILPRHDIFFLLHCYHQYMMITQRVSCSSIRSNQIQSK